MAMTTSTGIHGDGSWTSLKEIDFSQVRPEISTFLVPDERLVQCFRTVRDQVIFTNKRIIVVNVQGVTGKKVSYISYPYSKVQYFGIETASILEIESQLCLVFSDGSELLFDFNAEPRSNRKVNIQQLCAMISSYIL